MDAPGSTANKHQNEDTTHDDNNGGGDSEDKLASSRIHGGEDEEAIDEKDDNIGEEEEDEEAVVVNEFPQGNPKHFSVCKIYSIPKEGFSNNPLYESFFTNDPEKMKEGVGNFKGKRLGLTPINVPLPIALMLLDPTEYPSMSKARKVCRKGSILYHKGPVIPSEETDENGSNISFSSSKHSVRGRVDTRCRPGDIIGYQIRMGGGVYYQDVNPEKKTLPFHLPVIYEDDHMAIVNKPSGILVYSSHLLQGGHKTIRSALPFVLQPPKNGTHQILRRPMPVHRLDKPTSGLLLIAKTKPAHIDLKKQFVEHTIKKTYCAIVNGVPKKEKEDEEASKNVKLSSKQAYELGVDIDDATNDTDFSWELIDSPMKVDGEMKSAITIWRPLKYVQSINANSQMTTVVELKPKTGRYHQLRRHMALVKESPIVGDTKYDHKSTHFHDANHDLFLCSNQVMLQHPYYNTEAGRKEWLERIEHTKTSSIDHQKKKNDQNNKNGYDSFDREIRSNSASVEVDRSTSNPTAMTHEREAKPQETSQVQYAEHKINKLSGSSVLSQVWYDEALNKIFVKASIPLPTKFEVFIEREEKIFLNSKNFKSNQTDGMTM